jgi:hypothetical protein
MPQILYFNGRRVAMGDDLEPIVLFDKAKPGDKVTVAVKLLHTVDKKTFAARRCGSSSPRGRPNPGGSAAGVSVGGAAVPSLAPGDAVRWRRWKAPSARGPEGAGRARPGQVRRQPEAAQAKLRRSSRCCSRRPST